MPPVSALAAKAVEPYIEVKDHLKDQAWRLHNLYWVVDKDGNLVKFEPNWAQLQIIEELRRNQLILKARQLGASMGIQIIGLDCALWIDNWTSVTIAHEKTALEKMFRRNVEGPFNSLPESIREEKRGKTNRTHELVFSNGSSVSVALSTRSGTVNWLHVSEFGKVCAKYPHKSKEIVTGAFESVPPSGFKIIESTAEGQHGYFYDYCQEALNQQREGRELHPDDWGITFLPWWKHPEYVSSPKGLVVPPKLARYFTELEAKIGQELGLARKAWYTVKWKTLGDEVKREHPATPEEAFEQTLEGAFYAEQMTQARSEGRITHVPYQAGALVHTWWDLGVDDATAIWFAQEVGKEIHLIDYVEGTGEGLQHYARILAEKKEERGWIYGEHIGPHDLKVREWGNEAQRRVDTAAALGIEFTVCPDHTVADGIEAVRNTLGRCWFDAERCADGIKALDSYRKEWDEVRGTYRQRPLHDWASHPADAFRTGVVGGGRQVRPAARAVQPARRIV